MHMARHDALTNLPNRVLFREKMERGAQARREICGSLPRSRSLQERQRYAWASGRRRVAVRGDRTAASSPCAASIPSPGSAATSSPSSRSARGRRMRPSSPAASSNRFRKPSTCSGHQVVIGTSIGIAVAPDRRQRTRPALAQRRHGALSRQGRRARHLSLLPAGNGRADAGAPQPRTRPAQGGAQPANSSSTTSRSSISPATRSAASRRWCAGTIRSAAWSPPTISFRWPRRSA